MWSHKIIFRVIELGGVFEVRHLNDIQNLKMGSQLRSETNMSNLLFLPQDFLF
jgi:hypothetical protein